MASSRTQKNKAHKTRFSSKSSRNIHKENTSASTAGGARRGHNAGLSQKGRAARLNHSKNIRDQKKAALLAEKRLGVGSNISPPIVLALIALTSKRNLSKTSNLLLNYLKEPKSGSDNVMDIEDNTSEVDGKITHLCHRHKLRLNIIEANQEDLQSCLAATKVADVIAFVTTVTNGKDQLLNKEGKILLSMLRAQGLPTVIGLMEGLVDIPAKKRSDAKKLSASALGVELPENSKLFFSDAVDDFEPVFRYLSGHRLLNPQWRSQRPYVMAQKLDFIPDHQMPERGTLLLSGYVRGRGLSVNQLVHVTGIGDFQLKQIDVLEDPHLLQRAHKAVKGDQMQIESSSAEVSLLADPGLQEAVIVENIPDTLAGEQTWPTEDELANAMKQKKVNKRLLPKGTSEYQAAWILDEASDDDEDSVKSDEKMDTNQETDEEDGVVSEDRNDEQDDIVSYGDGDDDCQSEMMVDEELTEEDRRVELERLKAAHAADEEFPDEVDTPLDVPARKRFAKYRGLKSLRTSTWDPTESLPREYARIFSFERFQRTQKNVFAKAREIDEAKLEGSVCAGAYVRLHVKDFPLSSSMQIQNAHSLMPATVCGLLQHESKMSVVHFSIKKHESFPEPLKSKEPLIFHTGFRMYKTRPIFSTDDINMDKHKMERFLHPGRFSVASVFAPICFSPLPLVVFKEAENGDLTLAASGSLKCVDPDRIILKKIILSGYPQRVQKKKAVVRFMFHNPEDVRWFKPLELSTKYGRRGRIKEPVGTHGAMKCVFDGVLQQRDAVCVSLYKRVYPKWPESK